MTSHFGLVNIIRRRPRANPRRLTTWVAQWTDVGSGALVRPDVVSVPVAAKTAKTQKRAPRRKKGQLFCYTKDLMAALGVTRRSVYQYVQRRLLPQPILYSNGKTGVRARWSVVALDHAEFIVEQREIGYTLGEIAAMIAARWGTHDKVPLPPPGNKPPPAPSGNSTPSQGPPAEPS
jgi:hypothetical protein